MSTLVLNNLWFDSKASEIIFSPLVDFDLKLCLGIDPFFVKIAWNVNFDYTIESEMSLPIMLHIKFAFMGFRMYPEHPL